MKKNSLLALAITAVITATPVVAQNINQGSATASAELVSHLTHMREEEKIARDVYRVLYEQTGIRAFANITQSEQRHMDAMAQQLARFNIADPIKNDATGAFANPVFAKMYQDLINKGSVSTLDALYVGAYIEELDILDLQKAMAETNDASLNQVYGNLLRGSRNHLRAFVRQISRQGSDYQAQLMPQNEVDTILASAQERGHGGMGMGRGQGRGHGGGRGFGQGRGNF